jgi:CheY-like chemotaxis protein
MKDQFVATLSHELRGPLNAMVGWLHVVRGRGIDEATRERALGAIERAVRAQTRMIEDLFDYSRLVTGKLRLFSRPIDLLSVTTAAVESVRLAAEAKEISLELASEAKPAMVRGDWDRLQQVVWNLVSNAVKFTPRGGRVQVAIERAGTYLHLRVSDTGQGIPPDVLAHLFDRFRRAEGPRSRSQSGLGLGLTMVKQLVEQHGGRVRADSAGEGHGATFTVALPTPALLLEREVAEPAGRGTETAPASTNEFAEWARTMLAGVSVLVVEDDAESREMLVTVLRRCGANVRQAVSALEAMEALEHERPDVVVCDIGLPDRDGYSLIRRVRELSPERGGTVPALALTAYAGPDDRDMTLAAGFDLYLAKPADPEQLVTRIAALVGGARNTR